MKNNADVNVSMINAVRNGRVREVRELIHTYGLNYSEAWSEGYVLLRSVLEYKKSDVAKLLITSGSKVNAKKKKPCDTPLHFAVSNGDVEVVKMLLDRNAIVDVKNASGKTALHLAFEHKDACEIFVLLLKNGADINAKCENGESLLYVAVQYNDDKHKNKVNTLLEYGLMVDTEDVNNPVFLHNAIKNGYYDIVEILLKKGVDVELKCIYDELTPLHMASKHKQADVVYLLISHGADIHAKDKTGKSPIFYAIEDANVISSKKLRTYKGKSNKAIGRNIIEIFKTLLQYGVDVNATDNCGRTALHFTALYLPRFSTRTLLKRDHIYEEMVKLLICNGANIDAVTENGETVLHLVVEKCNAEICELLLMNGANVNASSKDGYTALHIASNIRGTHSRKTLEDSFKIASSLLKYGADINIICANGKTPIEYAIRFVKDFLSRPSFPFFNENIESYFNKVFQTHFIKIKAANLYLNAQNLGCLWKDYDTNFEKNCGEEITIMKSEKIENTRITFYEILASNSNSLAGFMHNQNVVKVLQSGEYQRLFPIYGSMIECNFRKGVEREKLLQEGYEIMHSYLKTLSQLPYVCIRNILSFLSNKDLKDLKKITIKKN